METSFADFYFKVINEFNTQRTVFDYVMSPNQKDALVCVETSNSNCSVQLNFPSAKRLESCDLTKPVCFVV